jgi:hypothetical protein
MTYKEQDLHLRPGITARLVEEEQIERRGDRRTQRAEQIGAHQPQHFRPTRQRQVILQSEALALHHALIGLRRQEYRDGDADHDRDEHKAAHQRHALERHRVPYRRHGQRRQQHAQRADHGDRLDPAVDPAALMIFGNEGRTPSRLRQRQDGIAGVKNQQPADQVDRAHAGRREEDRDGRYDKNRRRSREPRPELAVSGARVVDGDAQHRIEQDVDRPHRHERDADDGEGDADMGGIVIGEVDAQRRDQRADRHGGCGKYRDPRRRNMSRTGCGRRPGIHGLLPKCTSMGAGG